VTVEERIQTARGGTRFDVLSIGRVGVDLYPLQINKSLGDVETFGKFLGGSATNVAVAAARYGRRCAVITRTGADPFGDFIHKALRQFGVDDRWVTSVPSLPTPVTFCEIFPPDNFPVYFYRWPKAPDLEIRPEELDIDGVRQAKIFWLTVTGLCAEPSRSATLRCLQAREEGSLTVLDLDYRPMFWSSAEEARQQTQSVLAYVSVVVGNLEEYEMAVGSRDPEAVTEAVLQHGVELVIVKQGKDGVFARTKDNVVTVSALSVEIVNGLGAGDAFGGALCHGLLAGWDLERIARFGNAAGAIVASRLSCSTAMPTSREVERLLAENAHV